MNCMVALAEFIFPETCRKWTILHPAAPPLIASLISSKFESEPFAGCFNGSKVIDIGIYCNNVTHRGGPFGLIGGVIRLIARWSWAILFRRGRTVQAESVF